MNTFAKIVAGAILTLASLLAGPANAGSFVLDRYFTLDDDPYRPASWAQEGNTFDVQFAVRYNSDRCIGNYRARFVFDRDFRELRDGETFRIGIRKVFGTPPCGHKWTRALAFGASSFPLPDHPKVPTDYQYNGNIHVVQDGQVKMWDGNRVESTVVLQAKLKKDVPYTKISLIVGSGRRYHSLHLIYRYVKAGGVRPATDVERGVDRPGSDYRSFDQARADPAICEATCAGEARCRAWTWVRPGHQGPSSRCWLKYRVPAARQADCCVSGVK